VEEKFVINSMMSRTEKLDRVRNWLQWVMNSADGDQLLDEILDGSQDLHGLGGGDCDDGTLDALCRLMDHSTTRKQDLKLLMDFQRHQMAEYDRESERMIRILDDCGINDLKHPQLFAKADLLAQVAHTLRVDNPTQTELVGRLIDVKAEAVKAPLKKYILAKQADNDKGNTLKSLEALSKTETAHKIQSVSDTSSESVEKIRQKTAFIREKEKEYSRMTERNNALLEQRSKFHPGISCEVILALKSDLDKIREEEIKPLKASLDAFKGLPPDFQLAQAKLAEAQNKYDQLNKRMTQKIAEMQI